MLTRFYPTYPKLLSYMGYVELDYSKIEDEVMTSLDLNDDGKVDSDDVKEMWNRTMKASVSTGRSTAHHAASRHGNRAHSGWTLI